MQGALCICHKLHENTAHICTINTLAAIQGFRHKCSDANLQDLMDVDFSLIAKPYIVLKNLRQLHDVWMQFYRYVVSRHMSWRYK